jgi:hypothetical protein
MPKSRRHAKPHARYKVDDNAAIQPWWPQKYPAGNNAAEALVIYPLQKPQAPPVAQRDSGGAK